MKKQFALILYAREHVNNITDFLSTIVTVIITLSDMETKNIYICFCYNTNKYFSINNTKKTCIPSFFH